MGFSVHVMGPNLHGSNETFHVHGQGCADVRRRPMYRGPEHAHDRANTIDVQCLDDIVLYAYADMIDEEQTVQDLRNDFKVFPCVGQLPDVARCEWFLMCDNDATGTVAHPVLGDVPACDRCKAKASA